MTTSLNLLGQIALIILGPLLLSHGITLTGTDLDKIIGGITLLVGIIWKFAHYKASVDSAAKTATTASAVPIFKGNNLTPPGLSLFLFAALVLTLGTVGCALPKDLAHVYDISADVTTVGISQNPTTQMYELGLKRGHVHTTIIPIVWETNGMVLSCVIPDVVISDELNGRNSIFGGAGGTITVATGTNGTQTVLGGNHQPINEGSGTNLPK